MGKTSIEWTDRSWNPGVYGCSVDSPACDHCYAAKMAHRLVAMGVYPEGITKMTKAGPHWSGRVIVADGVNTNGLPKRGPTMVFTTSMADLFHADVPDGFIGAVFDEMRARPGVTFLVLTKRAERMAKLASWLEWPRNAWAMITVENQEQADRRIPWLLKVPAVVRGLSMEPLLGPVDLQVIRTTDRDGGPVVLDALTGDWWFGEEYDGGCGGCAPGGGIGWVITGGESGARARPSHPDWFRALRDQCAAAEVPFHFKQWGEWVPRVRGEGAFSTLAAHNRDRLVALDGTIHCTHGPAGPGAAPMSRVGKAAAGRLLDGVQHDEVPDAGR